MRNRSSTLTFRAMLALAVAAPAMAITIMPAPAMADGFFGISIRIGYAPPPIPVYAQPPLPGPDYIWVPGHWAWSDWIDDYYWVNGYWELPPEPGLLWTPAWWGWEGGAFGFHQGYWGREVGWYGGIDYGFGYHGHGWEGGHWDHDHVAYNGAVVNVTNVHVTNVYYHPVTVINNGPRVSYSGGAGGVQAQPTPQELRASQGPHIPPTAAQQQRVQQAATNPRAAASQMTRNWNPPPVHRVAENGTPIPRAAALATGTAVAGAPPAYQRGNPGAADAQGQNPARGNNAYAPAYRGAPAPTTNGGTPGGQRPAWQNQTGAPAAYQRGNQNAPAATLNSQYQPRGTNGYAAPQRQVPPPQQAPAYTTRPAPAYTPRPAPAAPAVPAYHAPPPAPAPQFHAAPPPPRPAPPARPAPAPQPRQESEHDHRR